MIKPHKEDFFTKTDEIINRNLQKKAYDINLIDELHANENAHTRILMKLLEFNRDGVYFIFQKFLDILNEKLEEKIETTNFDSPKFQYQWANIDGYIYQDKGIAIIIENKIQWAIDQNAQIERYVETAKQGGGISPDKIYVVYLTDDGRKKVENYSLTPHAKKILGVDEDKAGRFIELNYKDDLLPLFKDILTYLDFSKEVYLKSAIIQYIDYLDGRFGRREREKEFLNSILSDMLRIFSIEKEEIPKKTVQERASLYYELCEYLDDVKKDNVELFRQEEAYFCRLVDYIYPDEIKPSKVKNNFFLFFARNESNKEKMFPFNSVDIKWNSYPNIVKFSFSKTDWLKIDFPTDDFKIQNININNYIEIIFSSSISNQFSILDGWEKDQWNQYRIKILYEDYYQLIRSDPAKFLNSVIISKIKK